MAVRALLITLLAGGCHEDLGEYLQSGQVLAMHGLQGRWVGSVIPAQPGCGAVVQGLMTIGARGFGFDPFQSTTVINGEVSDGGRLVGNLVRQGADHHDISISFEGNASDDAGRTAISGILQSGRCRWTVTLHRG
jgi:hypothetical protein